MGIGVSRKGVEFTYPMRAERLGRFHALPVLIQAMYVPEQRGNSTEQRVAVVPPTAEP